MRALAILLLAATGIYAAGDAVLAVIRLAIIFAGAFVIASVVGLSARRQWVTKIGPVEVLDVDTETQRRGEELEEAHETIAILRQQLAVDNDLIRGASGNAEEAI